MDLFLALVRVALAGVLVIAAVGKGLDRHTTRDAVIAFRLPEALAGPAALLVPVAEVTVAGLLLVTSTARVGGITAVALFAGFLAIVARAVRAGEAPPCHCFGRTTAEPVGLRTVVRNALLVGLAAVVAVAGPGRPIVGDHVPGWAAGALAMLCVASVVAAWSYRQTGRRDGDQIASAPTEDDGPRRPVSPADPGATVLRSADGSRLTLADRLDGRRDLVVVGTTGGCGPCRALIPRVRAWQRSLEDELAIVVVQWGRPGDLPPDAADEVLAVDRSAFEALGFGETPSARVLRIDGVAEPAVVGSEAVEVVVRGALRRAARTAQGSVTSPAR